MRQFFSLIILALLIAGCKPEQPKEVEMITPEEMQELRKIDDVQLVDIRTPEEYEEGYIDGFQNIDYFSKTFDKDIEELDKSKPVIVYCKTGRRTAKCSKKMVEAGFVKIYDLDGGITQWKHDGYKVESLNTP